MDTRSRDRGLLLRGLAFGCGILLALVFVAAALFMLFPLFFRPSTPVAVITATPAPVHTAESDAVDTPTLERTNTLDLGITIEPPPNTSAPIPTITPAPNPTALPVPVTQPATTPDITEVPPPPTANVPIPSNIRLRVGNGPDALAPHFALGQFVLDGQLNEWASVGVPLTFAHFGADAWQGPQDLSGTGWLGWDDNNLLFAASVRDDTRVQTASSWEMFRGDSVELWIDADLQGDFDAAVGDGDDWQFGFSPGDFQRLAPEGVVYIPVRDASLNQQVGVEAKPAGDGYTLEARIPWSALRVRPQSGLVLGYTIDLSDNDVPGTAQQQTQVTEDPRFQFNLPATFGNLILQ